MNLYYMAAREALAQVARNARETEPVAYVAPVKPDREKLIALLKEFGIPFDNEAVNDIAINVGGGGGDLNGKVQGYGGFQTLFEFDHFGKFLQMRIWE